MTDWGRVIRCAAVGIGAAAVLAGCNGGGGGTSNVNSSAVSATATVAPDVPTSFDGCKLPQSVLDAEQITPPPNPSNLDANGGLKFRGCIWVSHDGDGFSVNARATNMTVQMIEKMSDYKVAEHLAIDGRQAVTYHSVTDTDLRESCLINVEIKGGGVDLLIDNPASNKATCTLDACEIAKKMAGEIVPTLPASA